MDMDQDPNSVSTAQGDLADVVARANALSVRSSAAVHPRPPPAASAATMSPHQHQIPLASSSRRALIFEPQVDLPFLPPGVGYGFPQQQQQLVQISQQAYGVGGVEAVAGGAMDESGDEAMQQILAPSPHQMMKRKNEVKKVVCIPAPPATSGRPGGGEVIPSDLWAWRKYGQKPIKGSPYPRGYYRCSSSKGCLARKQVERSRSDPNMLVITYTAEHNHPWPMQRNVLAGYARPHTSNKKKNKTDISSSSSNVNSSLEQNAACDNLEGEYENAITTMTTHGATVNALGETGAVMYEPNSQSDEVFAELEELEPDNTMSMNFYSKVSYEWQKF